MAYQSKLSKRCIEKLNEVPLYRLISGTEGSGMTKHCRCPKCGKEGKLKGKYIGLNVVDDDAKRKHFIKCHSCEFKAGGGAINVIMSLYDKEFREACEYISIQTGIQLEEEQSREERKKSKHEISLSDKSSFCARQLAASGLTYDDVRAKVIVDGNECEISPFRPGSLNVSTGRIDECADEMLILYYDLEGRRRTYLPPKNKTREMPYTRVRYSNPESHKDKRGKPVKYRTPEGARSELYIPHVIRMMYKARSHIETLFIQEGEKKAEKACKHGICSIAIQGIGNLGRKEEGLPDEIQYLVQKCDIKNIVFLMDADWNNLKSNLKDNDSVDNRPRDFARALIKFKKYIATLALCGLSVDIWFAHVNDNEAGDKGIDDLLTNTLKGCEQEILPDIEHAMLAHDGKGRWLDIINVTSYSDMKILDLWSLNNKEDFFELHRESLLSLKTFRFSNVFYKVIDSEIKLDSEYGEGKEFWSVWYNEKGKKQVDISLIDIISFLNTNGFRTYKSEDNKRAFVKIEGGIIAARDDADIRKFVIAYVFKATKDSLVKETFLEYVISKINNTSMTMLEDLVTNAGKPTKDAQRFYFRNVQLRVTDKEIEVSRLVGPVWKENLVDREFERRRIIKDFRPDGRGSFVIELTAEGRQCEFLSYLFHVSDMWKGLRKTEEQDRQYRRHIANKISCIGYLLRDYKQMSAAKAVIGMDSVMSEVGKSRGRSGKSLVGKAISRFIRQAEIDGRTTSNDDPYIFSEVTRYTKNIFIDDIQPNFDIGRFYQRITGKLNVNIKQGGRFYIEYEEAPKFLITTNHALSNIDDSAAARLTFMSFSNWYSAEYTVKQEFGHDFWADWDDYQWSLFDNFMVECVQIYCMSAEKNWGANGLGLIDPPMEGIELRTLRQEMGELFLQWAEVYFAVDGPHINCRMKRKAIFDDYLQEFNIKASQMTAKNFKSSLVAYCNYAGLHLNGHRQNRDGQTFADWMARPSGRSFIGERDMSNSIEYYTIATTDFLISQEV